MLYSVIVMIIIVINRSSIWLPPINLIKPYNMATPLKDKLFQLF